MSFTPVTITTHRIFPTLRIFPEKSRRYRAVCLIAAFLTAFCFVFGTAAQPVQAAVKTGVVDEAEKNRTTMYVSSDLTGRSGLCILLENVDKSGKKKFGMIDTGNANTAAMKAFLNKHGVKTLEFLIMTHFHRDHDGNAVWVLKNYNVKSLYLKQFDAAWSNGDQSVYENVLRTAVLSPNVKKICGVSYALSINRDASPKASDSFITFLKSHAKDKGRFKGLFTASNTSLYLGQTSLRLFNWEIWAEDGIKQWVPGKNRRCKVQKYTIDRSDNHFSMGVRVTRGSQKIWIGGDMTNLRLKEKRHAPYKGDEDRLKKQIGKVDAAVLNHHGRGGSNVKSFLKTLNPTYVIYTSTKSDILSGSETLARSTWSYIRYILRVPADKVLWACNFWGFRPDDPTITLNSDAVKNSSTDSSDSKNSQTSAASTGKGLAVSFLPGKTYSGYDVTGDGKKDVVSIVSPKSGDTYKGLTININKQTVWSTETTFKDTKPVTLVRLPGKKPYFCISILSPAGTNSGGSIFGLYQYGRKQTAGTVYGLVRYYNFLEHMPVNQYVYTGAPSITCSAKAITVVTTGSDTLSSKAFVSYVLEADNNKGLKAASWIYPYTTVKGKTGTITLTTAANLYAGINATAKSSTLPKGQKVTVTGVCRNKDGITRYHITDSRNKVWWINAPAAAKR